MLIYKNIHETFVKSTNEIASSEPVSDPFQQISIDESSRPLREF